MTYTEGRRIARARKTIQKTQFLDFLNDPRTFIRRSSRGYYDELLMLEVRRLSENEATRHAKKGAAEAAAAPALQGEPNEIH